MILESVTGKFKIVFPVLNIPTGQYKVTLWVTTTGSGSFVEYDARDLGIWIAEHPKIKWLFDDREFFLLHGNLRLIFGDQEKNLHRMITHNNLTCSVDFEYKKTGSGFVKEFNGFINYQDRKHRKYKKFVEVSFLPRSKVLNETATFINGSFNNVMNYAFSPDNPANYHPVKVKDFITDLYKIINPNITVDFFQNWNFKTHHVDSPEYTFDDLYMFYELAFINIHTSAEPAEPNIYNTYMKVLKALAKILGCFTGLISEDRAYFGMFMSFVNDSSEYVEVSDFEIDDFSESTPERQIKYGYLSGPRSDWWGNRLPTFGYPTGLKEDEIELNVITPGFILNYNGTYVSVQYVKSPGIDYCDPKEHITRYWASYYLRPEIVHRDQISFRKIDFDVSNKIAFDGTVYLWLELEKDYGKRITTAKVLPIGTAPTTEDPGDDLIVFDKMIRAEGVSVVAADDTEIARGIDNTIHVTSKKMFLKFSNPYGSDDTTAEEYDGTAIAIPADQLNVWYTIEQVAVYIAVSKNGNAPDFDYPNPDDTEADWFRVILTPIRPQKEPDDYVRILLPRLDSGKKPYLLYVFLKSKDAILFPSIKIYAK
jgi:hypothetical protein